MNLFPQAKAKRLGLAESTILAIFGKEKRKVMVYINLATVRFTKDNSKTILCGDMEHFNSQMEILLRASS